MTPLQIAEKIVSETEGMFLPEGYTHTLEAAIAQAITEARGAVCVCGHPAEHHSCSYKSCRELEPKCSSYRPHA